MNSLAVATGTTVVALPAGLLAALWLNCLTAAWRRAWLLMAVVGLSLPPFLVTNCWLDLAGQTGRWRMWFPINIYSLPGTIWILALLLWPLSLLLVLADLQKLQPSQLETDGALRGWSLVRWLVLPIARPALAQAAVLIFILALNNFAVPAILQTKVYPAELWVNFNTTFDYGTALKLSWPLFLAPLLLWFWLSRRTSSWPRLTDPVSPGLFRRRLGRAWLTAAALVATSVLILAVAIPMADLVLTARTWLELPGALAAGRNSIINSGVIALGSSLLVVLTGFLIWRWRFGVLLWMLFLMPGVLLGIFLIFCFNRSWLTPFYQSIGIVFVAFCVRYAAVSWSGVRQAMQSMDARLMDFARLNGASRFRLLCQVQMPQVAPAAAALCYVIYLLCLWDVETLVLIVPPGGETLALRIFNLLHYGHNAQVNALCVVLLGLAALPLGLWSAAAQVRRSRFNLTPLGAVALALLWTGCAPSSATQASIDSKLFSRVEIIGSRGTALGQFNKPRSVAVDSNDNLYVVDMTGRVQKFSSNGVYLTSWQMPQIEKGKPKGMCRDAAGNVVVVEPHYSRVNHFSTDGKLVAQWGHMGTNSGQLCLPRAAAINSQGHVLVCEYTAVDRVQEFSALGKEWIRTFGKSGLEPGELNRPEGLAVGKKDEVFVADSCNHRIQVFAPDGKFLRAYGHAGSGPGEFSYPYDICLDHSGHQFVCEFGNSRIQVFDEQDRLIEVLGQTGAAPGQFSNPWSIALDSAGNLYVADSQNHRVQKFIRKASMAHAGTALVAAARGIGSAASIGLPQESESGRPR
jgi:ABC-type Fe3+ transport system permease subunit/DNA-binding beta-propeller fold protein YncE